MGKSPTTDPTPPTKRPTGLFTEQSYILTLAGDFGDLVQYFEANSILAHYFGTECVSYAIGIADDQTLNDALWMDIVAVYEGSIIIEFTLSVRSDSTVHLGTAETNMAMAIGTNFTEAGHEQRSWLILDFARIGMTTTPSPIADLREEGSTEGSGDGATVGILVGVLCALLCVIVIGVLVFCGLKRKKEAREEKERTDAFSIRMDGVVGGAQSSRAPQSPHMALPSVSTASFMNHQSASMVKVNSASSIDAHNAGVFSSPSFTSASSHSMRSKPKPPPRMSESHLSVAGSSEFGSPKSLSAEIVTESQMENGDGDALQEMDEDEYEYYYEEDGDGDEAETGFLSVEEARASSGAKKENLMSDGDFESVFGMAKDAFYGQPMWKQTQQKKNNGFF